MRRILVSLLLVLFAVAVMAGLAAAALERSVDKELAKLAADPAGKEMARHFEFIVLGDNRTPWNLHEAVQAGKVKPFQPEIFKQAIAEANLLRPAFVIDVGDLIMGYDTPEMVNQEWDDYLATIAASQRPFISVTGNHDVFGPDSEKIWQERIGPLYFSFDYGNSHFICLNSEEMGLSGEGGIRLGQEQISWMKSDLEAHKEAQNIFVFLHKPFFKLEDHPESNWPEIHEILKQYPVRVVFAGHWHEYRKCETRDGIQHVITGGGGAEVESPPQEGSFHHYLLVEVDGAEVHWTVIKPGSVLPPEVVDEALIREKKALQESITFSPPVEPYADAQPPKEITVTIPNPSAEKAQVKVAWESPRGWQIRPMNARLEIAPSGKASAKFKVQVADARYMAALPNLVVEMPASGGRKFLPIRKPLATGQSALPCPRAQRPPRIDGNLSEWQAARPVWIAYDNPPKTWKPQDISARMRMMWDDKWLYIGAEVWDDVFIAPKSDKTLFEGDSVSVVISGFDCALVQVGGKGMAFRVPEEGASKPVPGARVVVSRKPGITIYEAALPFAEILGHSPKAGDKISRGAYWHDVDPKEPRATTWQTGNIEFK